MATTSSSSSSFQHKTPNNNNSSGENRAFLSNGSLFVGNLHPSVTESDLYDLFSHVASVVSISIRRSRKGQTTANYAFVNLQDSQQASNAMRRLNYTPINGKPIRIGPSYRNRTVNLIVKNLDASIDDKSLHDTFADFGNIISWQVAKDRSGQSKRYGFVQFEDEKAAHDAIRGLNGFLIKDKPLCVNLFIQSERRNLVIGTQKFTKVYIRNFSEATSEEDLRETFGKFGPVTRANVIRDANGKSRFFGFVTFQNPDDAAVAVENINGVAASDGKVWHVQKAMGWVKRERLWQDKPGLEGNEYLRGGRVNGGSLNRASSEFGSATSVKVRALFFTCLWCNSPEISSVQVGYTLLLRPGEANRAAQNSQETVNAVPFPLAQNSQGPIKVVPFASDIRRFCAVGPKLTPRLLTFLQQPYPWIRPAATPNFVAVCPQHQMVKSNANQGFMQVPNVVDTYVVPQMPLNVSDATVLSTNAPRFGPAPLSKLPYAVVPAVLQHPQHFMQPEGNQRFLYLSNAWNMVNPLLVPPWPTSPMPFDGSVSATHVPPVAVPLPVPVSFCLFMSATSHRHRTVLGKEVSLLLERLKHANIRHLNRSPRSVFFSGKTISIASADPKRIVLNHLQNSATVFHQNRSNFSMIAKHSTEGEEEIEICMQGSAKTELCNKWEKNGSCPYGDKCTFAHGIHELRPVLRKPKFKADLCREFRSGGTCRYGYRCHFRHSLEPEVVL